MSWNSDVDYLVETVCESSREVSRLQGKLQHVERENKELLAEKLDSELDNQELNDKINDLVEYYKNEINVFRSELDSGNKTPELKGQYDVIITGYQLIINRLED